MNKLNSDGFSRVTIATDGGVDVDDVNWRVGVKMIHHFICNIGPEENRPCQLFLTLKRFRNISEFTPR